MFDIAQHIFLYYIMPVVDEIYSGVANGRVFPASVF